MCVGDKSSTRHRDAALNRIRTPSVGKSKGARTLDSRRAEVIDRASGIPTRALAGVCVFLYENISHEGK